MTIPHTETGSQSQKKDTHQPQSRNARLAPISDPHPQNTSHGEKSTKENCVPVMEVAETGCDSLTAPLSAKVPPNNGNSSTSQEDSLKQFTTHSQQHNESPDPTYTSSPTRGVTILQEKDDIPFAPEECARVYMKKEGTSYLGFDIGSSSITAYILSHHCAPLQVLGKIVHESAIAFPPRESFWNGSLEGMLFGEAALHSQSDTLLTYWKPFHLSRNREHFDSLRKEFQYQGYGHDLLSWSEDEGLCYEYKYHLMSSGATISFSIPLWKIEHEILRRLLRAARQQGYEVFASAVYTMPVSCTMKQRQRRCELLTKDTTLSEYVNKWQVLTESSAAFLGKLSSLKEGESQMMVVDLGEGTLDISTGCSTHEGITFSKYLGRTDVRGSLYTDVIALALWELIDRRMVDTRTKRIKVNSCRTDYGDAFVQAVYDMCRTMKEQLCNMSEIGIPVKVKTLTLLNAFDSPAQRGYNKVNAFIQENPRFEFTVQQFKEASQILNQKLIQHVETCLTEHSEALDVMVLVGRPMHNPHLVQAIREHFANKCGRILSYNVDAQVAEGAAWGALLHDYDFSTVRSPLTTNVFLEVAKEQVGPQGERFELMPIFPKGMTLPLCNNIQTWKTNPLHEEIDLPIFVGDTEQESVLLGYIQVKAPKYEGNLRVALYSDERLLLIADHGEEFQLALHLHDTMREIHFDAFSTVPYIDIEREEEVSSSTPPPLEHKTRSKMRLSGLEVDTDDDAEDDNFTLTNGILEQQCDVPLTRTTMIPEEDERKRKKREQRRQRREEKKRKRQREKEQRDSKRQRQL